MRFLISQRLNTPDVLPTKKHPAAPQRVRNKIMVVELIIEFAILFYIGGSICYGEEMLFSQVRLHTGGQSESYIYIDSGPCMVID
jgi:hypothetical protein